MQKGFLDSGGTGSNCNKKELHTVATGGSTSPTSLATKICDIEKQMLDGKLVFVDDDGKPLKPKIVSELGNNNGATVGPIASEEQVAGVIDQVQKNGD